MINKSISASARAGSRVGIYCSLALYAVFLAVLSPKLSLWLDEILDLMGAARANFPDLIAYVRVNPGAVPLGYLAQSGAIHIFGLSAFSGRLPSVLSSIAACAGVYFLARRTGVRWPLVAAAIFAICPVQFRYALEARDYALALALSVGASVLFLLMLERPAAAGLKILYGLCVLAGVYTQPFSLFVPLAHLVWLTAIRERVVRRGLWIFVCATIVVSGLLFLPWYLYASGAWKEGISAYRLHGEITFHSFTMLLHELVGMGYLGTALMIAAAVLAGVFGKLTRSDLWFWLCYALVPMVCVLAVDKAFGYFFAIRQMIFVLAPLAILVGVAVERAGKTGVVLGLAFLVGAVWNDVKLFHRPREDWQAAARLLQVQAAGGACLMFAPADSSEFYTFFLPGLSKQECPPAGFTHKRVALAASPYDIDNARAGLERKLGQAGFRNVGELNPAGPRVELFAYEPEH